MIECPKCASTDTRLSRCKSPLEFWRRQLLATSPYRCSRCGWRGWVPDIVPRTTVPTGRPAQTETQPQAPQAVSVSFASKIALAAAPPRRDELDFHVLNIPHGPLYSRNSF